MMVKTRITLFIAGAGFIASLLFSVVVFYELIEQPFALLDGQLSEEAYRTTAMVVNAQKARDPKFLESVLSGTDLYWIEIEDAATGKVIFQSSLAASIRLPRMDPGSRAIVRPIVSTHNDGLPTAPNKDTPFRARTLTITLSGKPFIVRIARPMEKLNEEIRDLLYGIFTGLAFSTLILVVLSHFIAGKILRPIAQMKVLAQEISEKNLERRIPVDDARDDEFSELARTINRMLDRLQYSFARQREFLFDTSHELKTPLTTMRLAVDEISTTDVEGMPSLVRNNLLRLKNQVLRMERLVKDLLNLSSLEILSAIDLQPVRVSELLSFLAEEYRFIADSLHIAMEIHLPEGLVIQGDEEKLRRAFSNILGNALRYNMEKGRIALTAFLTSAGLTVTVGNTGPGVSEEDIPRIFNQFYRVERSRSSQHGGSGLGLSIVKRIVELHGGSVQFESEATGWNQVTVRLPSSR